MNDDYVPVKRINVEGIFLANDQLISYFLRVSQNPDHSIKYIPGVR